MKTNQTENDYLPRKDAYLKQLDRLFRSAEKILPMYMEPSLVRSVIAEAKAEFGVVLAELPDIGGDQNPLLFSYIASAAGLAYIRILERRGLAVESIGKSLYETYEDVYTSLPGLAKWWLRRAEFIPAHKSQIKAYADVTQKREYPDNWVMEYIEGNGIHFDYGCNYTECAVLKLYRKMGAEKYMPYVYVGDFAVSKALRTGLHRTTTLLYGGPSCDFRLKKNAEALPGLPFEELPEYKNRQC